MSTELRRERSRVLETVTEPLQTQPDFITYFNYKQKQKPDQLTEPQNIDEWRNKNKLKTCAVLITLCLNIGVDPPDVLKPNPCAVMEAWIDPYSKELAKHPLLQQHKDDVVVEGCALTPQKALELISRCIQQHYEQWQPRAKYKLLTDPTPDDLKKNMVHQRRNNTDRVLWHYNGHGVPKPTAAGELWVFNKTFTQYVPVGVAEIFSWLGTPSIFVLDCSAAGNFVNSYMKHYGSLTSSGNEPVIMLGACQADETLKQHPALPADLFTACLTTPIQAALHHFLVKSNPAVPLSLQGDAYSKIVNISALLVSDTVTTDMLNKIPGKISDRRTMLGELNWIFTAVTDSVAWCGLSDTQQESAALFKRLFRQDLMVAALFRNFLLARRVMKFFGCNPISVPSLDVDVNNGQYQDLDSHYLWDSWDLVCEIALNQLPELLQDPTKQYENSSFFEDQLGAFELWLSYNSKNQKSQKKSPHLPIILQVLLSQHHRLRALLLLSRYLDLSPANVKEALEVGIFPYVLKLLQSPAAELRLILVFIWSRICAYEGLTDEDVGCKTDLLTSGNVGGGYMYFVNILSTNMSNEDEGIDNTTNVSELKAMCAFILTKFSYRHVAGQTALLKYRSSTGESLINIVSSYLNDSDSILRQWSCILIGTLLNGESLFRKADKDLGQSGKSNRSSAEINGQLSRSASSGNITQNVSFLLDSRASTVLSSVISVLTQLLNDSVNDVRAAAVYAIGCLSSPHKIFSVSDVPVSIVNSFQDADLYTPVRQALLDVLRSFYDGSFEVRLELVIALSNMVYLEQEQFFRLAHDQIHHQSSAQQFDGGATQTRMSGRNNSSQARQQPTFHLCIWKVLLNLCCDPFERVATLSKQVVDFVVFNVLVKERKQNRLTEIDVRQKLQRLAQDPSISLPTGGLARQTSSQSFSSHSVAAKPVLSRQHSAANSSTLSGGMNQLRQFLKNSPSLPHKSRPQSLVDIVESALLTTKLTLEKAQLAYTKSLPLQSCCLKESVEFFRGSRLQTDDDDLPGGVLYMKRQWQLNIQKVQQVQLRKIIHDKKQYLFDVRCGSILSLSDSQSLLLFHSVKDQLVAVGEDSKISVWDHSEHALLSSFHNGNKRKSSVTSLHFLNELDESPLLLTGSNDGIVRIYDSYDSAHSLTASWIAMPEMLPDDTTNGLILSWLQSRGQLLAAGDSKNIIKLWDAEQELCLYDIPTKSSSFATSLDNIDEEVFGVGYGDGSLRFYDKRVETRSAMTIEIKQHQSWIVSLKQQLHAAKLLCSVSSNAEVRLWDLRKPDKSLQHFIADSSRLASCAALHNQVPALAVGSESQFVKVLDPTKPKSQNNTIRSHEGILGQRIAPVSCVAFHPEKLLMAFGGQDQQINLYGVI